MTAPTAIVKTSTTADLIALLPELAGMPLHNCVAIAPFWAKRTSGTLRIALPAARDPETARALAATALASLARLDGCDGVAVVLFTDETYLVAECGLTGFLDTLLERFHDSGYGIAEAAIVAADGWRGHFDGPGERDIAEIQDAGARLPDSGRHIAPTALPESDPALTDLVDEMLIDRLLLDEECDAFGRPRPVALPDPVDFLETTLATNPDALGALHLARLIALIQTEGDVDRTVLQIAFGRGVGTVSWQNTLAMRERAGADGVSPFDIMKAEHDGGTTDPAHDRLARMMGGDTDEAASAERLHAAAAILGRAIAHCSLPDRSWVMCALVWVRWALGLNTAADELVRDVAAVDPLNSLAPVFATLIAHCHPAWIYNRRPPAPTRRDRRAARRRR